MKSVSVAHCRLAFSNTCAIATQVTDCLNMSTQYDNIGALYTEMAKTSCAKMVKHNVRKTLSHIIKGAKVLDLACGIGEYSRDVLSWGASEVHGVDISSGMIEAAKAGVKSGSISFEVADGSKPKVYGSGEFDIVLGIWFLNYAATREQMTDMYRTIAMNLKDGGTFVGITRYPTENPRRYDEISLESWPKVLGRIDTTPTDDVEDGIGSRVEVVTDSGGFAFDCYYLRKSVYEAAAREGGLQGVLTWPAPDVPALSLDDPNCEHDRMLYQSYAVHGLFGLLVISKS